MARTPATDIRALLKAIAADGTFEANAACNNPVCRALARLEHHVDPGAARRRAATPTAAAVATTNGAH